MSESEALIQELLRSLVSARGFDRVFEFYAGNTSATHRQIFNTLNFLYRITYGGISRYASYDSYRLSRRKRIKKGN